MTLVPEARSLNQDELARALGVSNARISQWTKDGTIPPRFYVRDVDRSYRYSPVTVALGALLLELAGLFGENSSRPKAILQRVLPTVELAWHEPGVPARLTVKYGDFELRGPLTFVVRARQQLAAACAS